VCVCVLTKQVHRFEAVIGQLPDSAWHDPVAPLGTKIPVVHICISVREGK